MDRTLWPAAALLLVLFGIFEVTGIDLWLQDHFHRFNPHAWLVDAKAPLPRLLFYTCPKILIWVLGIGLIGLAVVPVHWRECSPFSGLERRDLWVAIATLATAPALVATAKATTNVFTPEETRCYGGFAPYVKVCEAYPSNNRPGKRGRGFPAGHASGGFALMGISGLAGTRRGRRICVAAGLTIGWAMGLYQMFKGAHFLSHTVISLFICWIVFLIMRRVAGHAGGIRIFH